jgi:hypothetical protein
MEHSRGGAGTSRIPTHGPQPTVKPSKNSAAFRLGTRRDPSCVTPLGCLASTGRPSSSKSRILLPSRLTRIGLLRTFTSFAMPCGFPSINCRRKPTGYSTQRSGDCGFGKSPAELPIWLGLSNSSISTPKQVGRGIVVLRIPPGIYGESVCLISGMGTNEVIRQKVCLWIPVG